MNKRIATVAIACICGALTALSVAWQIYTRFEGCTVLGLFGIPCPGCGYTRAVAAVLRGDISAALDLHPLVFLPPTAAVAAALSLTFKGRARRWICIAALAVCLAAFLLCWVVRLICGWDGYNP